MALKIRLRRMGRKRAPTYRIVVAESSMPRDGRFVELLGHYNPRTNPVTLVVDQASTRTWLQKGAIPTDTVQVLLKQAGVFEPEATGVAGALAAVTEAVTETAQKATRAARGAVAKAAGAVASVATGAADAVTSAASSAVEAVQDTAASAVDAVQDTAHSAVEAVQDAVESVRERLAGDEDRDDAATNDARA